MSKSKKEQSTVEAPTMEAPIAVRKEVKNPVNKWEIKERTYMLRNGYSPLTLTIPSRHTRKHALLYFDKETGEQRELKYATNQDLSLIHI